MAEPRLQNIPIRTQIGRDIRNAFLPQVSVTADYSRIEMRIYKHLCKELGLTEDDIESNLRIIMSPRPQPRPQR